jgi:opacity protein-like surface antigen
LEPEDGCLWVYGVGDEQTIAFTDRGLESLQEIIAEHKRSSLPAARSEGLRCIQPGTSTAGAISQTRTGWTAGAGLEWMFARQWSAKVEYLYYDLGSVTFGNGVLTTGHGTFPGAGGPTIVAGGTNVSFQGQIVRVGVNYHWY